MTPNISPRVKKKKKIIQTQSLREINFDQMYPVLLFLERKYFRLNKMLGDCTNKSVFGNFRKYI